MNTNVRVNDPFLGVIFLSKFSFNFELLSTRNYFGSGANFGAILHKTKFMCGKMCYTFFIDTVRTQ